MDGNRVNQAQRPQLQIQSKIDSVIPAKLMPFFAAVWLLGWGIVLLGVPAFVPFIHRTLRGRDPSSNDFKIARFVGYIGILFGFAALIQGLIGLAH
jgi:hypothetical protein